MDSNQSKCIRRRPQTFIKSSSSSMSCLAHWAVICFVLLQQCKLGASDEHDHLYEPNDEVVLWMNTVGPFPNRQETYSYFSLPFCKGPKTMISHYHETLGEALQGVELEFSGLDIDYKANVDKTKFCEVKLSNENLQAFEFAVRKFYYYQMYIDDLPIMGSVGEVDETDPKIVYLYTHKKFDIGFNGKHIVDVNMTSQQKVRLEVGATIEFSYEVNWHPSRVVFEDRFDKYLDPTFFQHRNYLSILIKISE